MAFQGEYTIAASPDEVWAALNDAQVLRDCIPGCEELIKQSDTQIEARITAQLGPIRSKFSTQIVLSDLNPPLGYTLSGEGKGVAGFGRGSAKVTLSAVEGGTLLHYDAQLGVGGKLAQVGSRLVESATRSYADQFFQRFAQRLNGDAPAASAAAEAQVDAQGGAGAADDAAAGEEPPGEAGGEQAKGGKSRWWQRR